MAESTFANTILQVIAEYEADWQKKLQERDDQIDLLEQEIEELQGSISEPTAYGEVFDEKLRVRLSMLSTAPLDTIIRESGVVLEDRLREIGGVLNRSLVGVRLVDAVFSPGEGTMTLSDHDGEQEGVRMLYRGAIQFIRNPPMHRLIEYPEETAKVLVRMIDSLLLLMEEGKPKISEEVAVESVRLMLTRRPISKGQRELYKLLNEVGDKGIISTELAEVLERTPNQIAGLLGALGRRINQTKGLEGKGATGAILEITAVPPDRWLYKMRPVLKEALKAEGII